MISCVLVASPGCAHRAPVFMDATVEYPHLDSQTCANGHDTAVVALTVQDEQGAAIPGATAYLLPLKAPSSSNIVFAVSDPNGRAHLEAPGSAAYVVTVLMAGFSPSTSVRLFEAGCSGRLTVTLQVSLKYR
jgi:hypothetical protein